ncbi:uncharacterized protein LOC134231209 [Saccostrea cucullata]|uniref:uncharacterized protein LOC134231209 n=1 Tax=Saccostrea cuccullata TaxID=36930 RepID=UPI002ED0CB82
MAEGGGDIRDDPKDIIRRSYLYIKENLITHGLLLDELIQCSVLSDEEKVDFKDFNERKIGKLLKHIINKGEEACRNFLEVLKNPDYGIYHRIEEVQRRDYMTIESEVVINKRQLMSKYETLLVELEASSISDFLFQEKVFDIDTHDEIDYESKRRKKVKKILKNLENKSEECLKVFVHGLEITKQQHILDVLQNQAQETEKETCLECVRLNFRWIKHNLHFELTAEHLYAQHVIDFIPAQETTKERGRLVKSAVKRKEQGCFSLLKHLEDTDEHIFHKALQILKERKKNGRIPIKRRIREEEIKRYESQLKSELQPSDLSDILLEEGALSPYEHDEVENKPSRKKKTEKLLSHVIQNQEELDSLAYALQVTGVDFEELIKTNEDDDISSGVENRTIRLVPVGNPEIAGLSLERFHLDVTIQNEQNPESPELNLVVTVLNENPNVKIQVTGQTHMALKGAFSGSIILSLQPLTDAAINDFLAEDGARIKTVVESLLLRIGPEKLDGQTLNVEVSRKALSQGEKEIRSRKPEDVLRRKIREQWHIFTDELEPSQMVTFFMNKGLFDESDGTKIEKAKGRKRKIEEALHIILGFPNDRMKSFSEFLLFMDRKDLASLVDVSKVEDNHKEAEIIREQILDHIHKIQDEIESSIILETFEKFPHIKRDVLDGFMASSGKSRKQRVYDFLMFVLENDEFVLEFKKVLELNSMGHFFKPSQKEERKRPMRLDAPAAKFIGDQLFKSSYVIRTNKGKEIQSKELSPLEKIISSKEDEPQPSKTDRKHLPFLPKGDKTLSEQIFVSKSFLVDPDELKPKEKDVVVAIDFGTTYSGFAYSFSTEPSLVTTQEWKAESVDKSFMSLKTPTTLLLDDQDEFVAFGYKAEQLYKEFVEDERHTKYRFFKNFKMTLHKKESLDSTMMIEDHQGKPLSAMEVFAKSLNYLKETFWESIKSSDRPVDENKVFWIITVPAIWDEFSKQFMKNAAEKVGIPNERLTLALEPEVAAIYVITEAKLVLQKSTPFTKYEPGQRILVADLGGGTADFSVVEVTKEYKLEHLHYASGGAWGGNAVNIEIYKIFTEIFGEEVMGSFWEMKAEVLEMENEIELKKRDLKLEGKLSVRVLPALASLCEEIRGDSYKKIVAQSNLKESLKVKAGAKIIFETDLTKRIIDSVVGQIARHIKTILEVPKVAGVKTIILVGGFAECDIVHKYITREFPEYDVKIPLEPGLAVLKGAVKFGHNQGIISARVCDYTYGIETNRYPLATDPKDKIQWVGDKRMCIDYFEKIISIGDMVKVGEERQTEVFASTEDMTKMTVNIYRSRHPNPQFITDKGCELFGEMTVNMPITKGGQERTVVVSMKFGETEILFSGQDKTSGERRELTVKIHA